MMSGKKIMQLLAAAAFLLVSLAACASAPAGIIKDDPQNYLLKEADLPARITYYSPENGVIYIPNEMAIGAFGKEKGEALVKDEERVTAARLHFQRAENQKAAADTYLSTVTLHQSAKGAQTAVEKYNYAALYPDGGWKIISGPSLGDKTLIETGETNDPQGHKAVNYRIEFAYRNASVDILVFGLQSDVTLDTATQAAQTVLNKLKTAPLGSGPIPTPTPLQAQ